MTARGGWHSSMGRCLGSADAEACTRLSLMFASRTMFSMTSRWRVSQAANSPGVVATSTVPNGAMRATTAGSRDACVTAALSLATTASGVPAGANSPFQSSMS